MLLELDTLVGVDHRLCLLERGGWLDERSRSSPLPLPLLLPDLTEAALSCEALLLTLADRSRLDDGSGLSGGAGSGDITLWYSSKRSYVLWTSFAAGRGEEYLNVVFPGGEVGEVVGALWFASLRRP